MAIDLGNAYVQIIPSAQGIKGKVTEALGGESKKAGEEGGKSIAAGIVSTLKTALVAAGIGTIIKSALDEGGKLQQSFGGLDTIYGDAADAAKKYAAEAVKAGISSNDYAEQAVSFGASLKQAFAGDTTKAVEAANTAIMDMTDNAAKMGTPLENIQNAYQGFAKQNYTMLDNLKLGYGGTKQEMQRLLADAEKLSGQKYDISNLGDVYDAIHVIQGELGLTGVAAAEASETFSGSFGAMAAAAKNFLGALALGDGVDSALAMLMQTTATFVTNNLLPMVGNILTSLPTIITTAVTQGVPILIESFRGIFANIMTALSPDTIAMGTATVTDMINGIMTKAPDLITAGSGMVTNLLDGIGQNGPTMITSGAETVNGWLDSVLSGLPGILDAGAEFITNLANGATNNLPALIEAAGGAIASFYETILNNAPAIMESGMRLLEALGSGIIQTVPVLMQAGLGAMAQLIQTFLAHLPQLLECGISLLGQLIAGIIQKTPEVISTVAKMIGDVAQKFLSYDWGSLGRRIIEGIAKGLANAGGLIVNAAKEAAGKAFRAAKDFLKIGSPSKLFRDEVGAMMAEGMAIGFEDNVPTAQIQSALAPMANVVPDTLGTNYNYGGFAINIYQQPGQSAEDLADIIGDRINTRIQSARAVFA